MAQRTSSIRVTAAANISGSQVRIYTDDSTMSPGPNTSITPADGGPTLSGNTVSLPVGMTFIGIEVTALDTTTKSVYEVQVERISSGASSDATLMEFNLGGNIDVSPDFHKDVTSYKALVPTDEAPVTVTLAVTTGSGATVELKSDKDSTIADDNMVMLSVGVNVITAKVTAANLEATKTYTLRVTKAAGNASDDARLRSLSLSGITLSETFDLDKSVITGVTPPTVEYTANIPYRVTQTTVTHAVNQSGARATVTAPDDFNPLARGHQVFLGVGANTIEITARAENAVATRIYRVTVTRAAANASGDATLMEFNLGAGITVSPGFDKDVTSYTALVPNDTDNVTVIAPATVTGAAVELKSDKDSTNCR